MGPRGTPLAFEEAQGKCSWFVQAHRSRQGVARCLDMAIIPTYGYLYPYVDIFDDVYFTLGADAFIFYQYRKLHFNDLSFKAPN